MQIKELTVWDDGDIWRWRLVDSDGQDYLDGGNYLNPEDAVIGAIKAADLDAEYIAERV